MFLISCFVVTTFRIKVFSFFQIFQVNQNLPIVSLTIGYYKEKKEDKKIINEIYEIFEKLGQGSFWSVFKVERSFLDENKLEKKFMVFKEGKLNFFIEEEDQELPNLYNEENQLNNDYTNELNLNPSCNNDLEIGDNNDEFLDENYDPYSDDNLKNGKFINFLSFIFR